MRRTSSHLPLPALLTAARRALPALGLLLLGRAAEAQFTVYGVTSGGAAGQQLVRFDSSDPTNVTSIGLTGASLIGIDFRPANGMLYGYDGNALFTVNTATGVATQIFDVFDTCGSNAGFDFNPTVDRIRLTDGCAQNRRINPNNGDVIVDGNLTYPAGDFSENEVVIATGMAYTNNDVDPATGTTLYGVDGPRGTLVTLPNPNNGVTNTIGFLGIGLLSSVMGFDIVTVGGMNYAFLAAVNGPGAPNPAFYSVDLGSGDATLIGEFGTRVGTLQGIAIAPTAVPEPGTWALLATGLAGLAGVARRRRGTA